MSAAFSDHMVALLIRVWICYETNFADFVMCILSECKWLNPHQGIFWCNTTYRRLIPSCSVSVVSVGRFFVWIVKELCFHPKILTSSN